MAFISTATMEKLLKRLVLRIGLQLSNWQYFFPHLRECPSDLREAIASIIFAAPRCSDVPDLLQIKNLFTTKYGKEFVLAAAELRPESGVNREVSWLVLFS